MLTGAMRTKWSALSFPSALILAFLLAGVVFTEARISTLTTDGTLSTAHSDAETALTSGTATVAVENAPGSSDKSSDRINRQILDNSSTATVDVKAEEETAAAVAPQKVNNNNSNPYAVGDNNNDNPGFPVNANNNGGDLLYPDGYARYPYYGYPYYPYYYYRPLPYYYNGPRYYDGYRDGHDYNGGYGRHDSSDGYGKYRGYGGYGGGGYGGGGFGSGSSNNNNNNNNNNAGGYGGGNNNNNNNNNNGGGGGYGHKKEANSGEYGGRDNERGWSEGAEKWCNGGWGNNCGWNYGWRNNGWNDNRGWGNLDNYRYGRGWEHDSMWNADGSDASP
eukprot:TRINITY_DN9004_c0_g1_i1.p1 TRINITY_DN9004_c0_g1~~TRINITY_DN9004_c0_g1_i1.p1  ORF type:complete len:334 (-),score=56.68 TRINITY_DN9004_c0_g1_i1:754-1755(-)